MCTREAADRLSAAAATHAIPPAGKIAAAEVTTVVQSTPSRWSETRAAAMIAAAGAAKGQTSLLKSYLP